MESLERRFNPETLTYLHNVEEMLLDSCNNPHGEISPEILAKKFPLWEGDVDYQKLDAQLKLLAASIKASLPGTNVKK